VRQELLDHSHRSVQVDLDFAHHVAQIAILVEVQISHDPGIVEERI
jgi:hypothetical protein